MHQHISHWRIGLELYLQHKNVTSPDLCSDVKLRCGFEAELLIMTLIGVYAVQLFYYKIATKATLAFKALWLPESTINYEKIKTTARPPLGEVSIFQALAFWESCQSISDTPLLPSSVLYPALCLPRLSRFKQQLNLSVNHSGAFQGRYNDWVRPCKKVLVNGPAREVPVVDKWLQPCKIIPLFLQWKCTY